MRLHLKPTLGNTKLDRVSALQVQSLYRSKLDSGLSPRTVQIIHATLYKALKRAVRWSLLPRNVADSVDPPKAPKREIKPLDEEQVKGLLRAGREISSKPCTCWPSPRECVRVSFWDFNGKMWICRPG